MSILRVTDIRSNGSTFNDIVTHSNSGGTENARHCRAYVNLGSGSGTPSIRSNFNVNSVTDNGAGDFTVNFSNALSDGNYTVAGTALGTNGFDWALYITFVGNYGTTTPTTKTASACRLITFSPYSGSPGQKDTDEWNAIFFR